MIDLICGGVCERFPGLKFVISEFETGWVGQCLQRLDHATYRTPNYAVDYLTMKPSDYFHRNFGVTFEDDEAGVLTRHLIGVENLLWGNDYPHHDAIWPHSMVTLDKIMVGVPDDERERMCFSNTIKLYGIAPVIGTRTWGGVIGIDSKYTLVDGTGVTQPKFAFWFAGEASTT